LYTPQELVVRVTGEPLNPQHFIRYLKTKYAALYKLNAF
jgi:carboxypeptidase Taq